jgi:hypothetical protein
MLIVCLIFTSTAAIFTYFYRFDIPLSYAEVKANVGKDSNHSKESEKGIKEKLIN